MENLLGYFKFVLFQLILIPKETISLPPFKGSTFRGAFGHAFKKVVCINRNEDCSSCLLKGRCVYSYIFETPPPSDALKMRKYPFAPHPFIITPPLEEKRVYHQNDKICFQLTLIGKSIDYLPYFIYTFDELGRMGIGKGRGRYQLEEVKTIIPNRSLKNKGDGDEIIYTGKDKTLKNTFKVLKIGDPVLTIRPFLLSTLTLNFLTPTRLKFDGSLTPKLEFHILIRNLLRRISLLSYFHCGEELSIDFKGFIDQSKDVRIQKENLRWFDWERYSNRQETKMKMGGFIGSVTFERNFEPFLPFILLGEYIHVGKGTSFGLGKYEIVRGEN